jgi:hypothetical protein
MALHPARRVYGVPPEVVAELSLSDDPSHYRAGVDPDAQLERAAAGT